MTQAAGAKHRLFAFGLDYLLILGYMAILFGLSYLRAYPNNLTPGQAQLLGFLTLTLPVLLYFTLSEVWVGATLGKHLLALHVEDNSHQPLPMSRSFVRNGIKFLPWELSHTALYRITQTESSGLWLGLIYLSLCLAGLSFLGLLCPPYRPLYDRLSGATVYRRHPYQEELPA